MSIIIPSIQEGRLDKGGRYLLRYPDIQDCFAGKTEIDIYLSVYFEQYLYKTADQFSIVKCLCTGDFGPPPYSSAIRIDVSIMAVPHRMVVLTGITNEMVKTLLNDEIERVMQEGLTSQAWWTTLTLLSKTRSIAYNSCIGSMPIYGVEQITVIRSSETD